MTNRQLDEEAIFHVARGLADLDLRSTYLDQVCSGDQALRERVEALLDVHEKEQNFLKSSPEPGPTVDQTPISEAPGHQIGRYKLLQKIGEGGFGVVYMAEQERPVRRKVALKIIKPGMDTHAVVARFEAERQALALMDHPNISRVLDGGATESGRPYFVMELVKGVPITEYCDKNQLSAHDRLELFLAVCQAVQHAHQKGIIHRDIKPSNMLVTLHDGQPVVKVIDFGVAKAINQQLTEKTLFTAFGQMVGTPQYMSPEQAEMSGLDVDTRSDIYSLGVLLYELLTGTTPLEGERLRTAGYAEMQRIIREEEPPKPSTRLSGSGERLAVIAKHRSATPERLHRLVRGDLDWIVMKALEKDRGRRYETASSLADDIRRFIEDEPVTARRPSATYRLTKFTKRNKAAFVVAMGIALVLVFGVLTTLWQAQQAVAARDEAHNALEQLMMTMDQLQEALFDQGVAYALTGDFDSARHVIESLTRLKSESLARQLQAVVYLEEGQAAEVVGLLEPEAKRDPKSVALRALLTLAYDSAGDIDMWYQSHNILKDMQPITAEDYMFAAIAYIGDPEKAVAFASKAFDQRKSPSILLTRGRSRADLAMQAGRPEYMDQAIEDVSAACRLLGDSGRVPATRLGTYILSANAHRMAGHADWRHYLHEAADSVDVLLEKEHLEAWERLYLAEYFYSLDDCDRAWTFFESTPEAIWTDYHMFYYLALATDLGKPIESDLLSRLKQRSLGPFSNAGWAFVQVLQGQPERAMLEVDGILAAYTSVNSVTLALDICQVAGDSERAKRIAIDRLERLRGADINAWEGWMRDNLLPYHAGELTEKELVKRAQESQYPNKFLGHAHWTIAVKYLGTNKVEQARKHFELCVETRGFYLSHCWWSRALLSQLNRLGSWPPEGLGATTGASDGKGLPQPEHFFR